MTAAPDETMLHASCVAIRGTAVLILGASGAGKSDLALRLMDRGATLVSDDCTILRRQGERLIASPPATIAGRIEVRGIGIVDVSHQTDVPVGIAIDLDAPVDRMPEAATRLIGGVHVPLIPLIPREPSAPIKVELALSRFLDEDRA